MMMMQDTQCDESERQLEAQLMWADAVLLVYSVTDRSSFELVASLCNRLACRSDNVPTHRLSADTTPCRRHSAAVVVVGNKADLHAGRCVDTMEAPDVVLDAAQCLETSAMEGGPEITAAFETLCRLVVGRRSSTVSQPGVLTPNYNALRRRRNTDEFRRRFLGQQLMVLQAVDKFKRILNRRSSVDC